MKETLKNTVSAAFGKKKTLDRVDLLKWLHEVYPKASDKTLVWRISDLKSRGILSSPGRGVYRLEQATPFEPVLGNSAKRIASLLSRELPLVKSCIWETRWISNWMELQPPYNWTIVETEKEVLEFVFASLTGITNKVFLDPDQKVVDLYILALNEAVIVKPIRSESPTFQIGKITSAAPEKILVDIVAEPEIFRAQQAELDRIYANAFKEVRINQTKMLRYASRRRRKEIVNNLIPMEQKLPKTLREQS